MRPASFLQRFLPFLWMVTVCLGAGSAVAFAADHPQFSGAWKLDHDKSDFGEASGPSQVTDSITQTASALTIDRDRDGEKSTIRVPLDGTQSDVKLRNMPMKAQSHWDGTTLVIEYTGSRLGGAIRSEEKWTLSADGKVLTVERHGSSRRGETTQKLLMVKQ